MGRHSGYGATSSYWWKGVAAEALGEQPLEGPRTYRRGCAAGGFLVQRTLLQETAASQSDPLAINDTIRQRFINTDLLRRCSPAVLTIVILLKKLLQVPNKKELTKKRVAHCKYHL